MDIKIPKNDIPQWQKIHLCKICFITIKKITFIIDFILQKSSFANFYIHCDKVYLYIIVIFKIVLQL